MIKRKTLIILLATIIILIIIFNIPRVQVGIYRTKCIFTEDWRSPGGDWNDCFEDYIREEMNPNLNCKTLPKKNINSCYKQKAKLKDDPSQCYKIEKNGYIIGFNIRNLSDYVDDCLYQFDNPPLLNLESLPIEIVNEIINPETYENPQFCETLLSNKGKSMCAYYYAIKENDTNFCFEAMNLYQTRWRQNCFITLARNNNQSEICEHIERISIKDLCLEETTN